MYKSCFYILLSIIIISEFETFNSIAQEGEIISKGQKAPDFEITSDTGKSIRLSNLRGKVVLINFFEVHCGHCRLELPILQTEIWERYKDNPNFALLVIACNTSENLARFREMNPQLMLPIYRDNKRIIYSKFSRSFGIPRNYIIDTRGILVYSNYGYTETEFGNMLKHITSLLRQNEQYSVK